MTLFRPCIDLHNGKVKQIVGLSLANPLLGSGAGQGGVQENFVSEKPAEYYAELYKNDKLKGGHIIMLGAGRENEIAALNALKAYPNGMQIGGGISLENAETYLKAGAEAVVVTSYIFPEGKFLLKKLKKLSEAVGREKLIVDLSCKGTAGGKWLVAINKWQTITDFSINPENLHTISAYCTEFLIHAVAAEGRQQGMDTDLIEFLGGHSPLPATYAGGAKEFSDLALCDELSKGRVDLTIGSALDIFGGKISYRDCVKYNRGIKSCNTPLPF